MVRQFVNGFVCCTLLSRLTPRRGKLPVLDGWVQITRGPCLVAGRGPRAELVVSCSNRSWSPDDAYLAQPGFQSCSGISRIGDSEGSKAKEELQTALKRAEEDAAPKAAQSARLGPDAATHEARIRVGQLEKALEALGDSYLEMAGVKHVLGR